jgi:hypothetical protein
MNTAPDLTMPTAIAATGQTKAAAAPGIKLSSHGFSIDHPDPELGEQLMANALGVADREAMDGILRQLVKASMSGGSLDEVNLSFMISMVKSIKPRDSVEAMLVAQMVSVHVMAMRCAQHLASADDLAQHDSAARALGRLARTFPAQIEALNRYRSQGEPAITVQNVSVGDGGKAIVGNVTQHARVIVSDKNPGSAAQNAPKAARSRRRHGSAEAKRAAQHERSHQKYRPDAGEPALWRQNPFQRRVPLAGGAAGSGAPRANGNARKHGLFTRNAIAERRQIHALLGEARRLQEEMK